MKIIIIPDLLDTSIRLGGLKSSSCASFLRFPLESSVQFVSNTDRKKLKVNDGGSCGGFGT